MIEQLSRRTATAQYFEIWIDDDEDPAKVMLDCVGLGKRHPDNDLVGSVLRVLARRGRWDFEGVCEYRRAPADLQFYV